MTMVAGDDIEILPSPGQYKDTSCDFVWDVIVLGDYGVGKSNFITRLTRNEFSPQIKNTMQPESSLSVVKLDGKKIKLRIWDPSGLEQFSKKKIKEYYPKVAGVFLLYDITKKATFNSATDTWLKDVRQEARNSTVITLIGNKSDQRHHRDVDKETAQEIIQEKAKIKIASFFETSTVDGTNVRVAFKKTLKDMYFAQKKELARRAEEAAKKSKEPERGSTKSKAGVKEPKSTDSSKSSKTCAIS